MSDSDQPETHPTHATEVAAEHLLVADVKRRLSVWEHPDHSDVEAALRESIRALGNLVPSSFARRPVEVRVSIEDEEGCEVDQTVALTRAQGDTPAMLGSTVGHAVGAALRGFYVAADGAELGDALGAARDALDLA